MPARRLAGKIPNMHLRHTALGGSKADARHRAREAKRPPGTSVSRGHLAIIGLGSHGAQLAP